MKNLMTALLDLITIDRLAAIHGLSHISNTFIHKPLLILLLSLMTLLSISGCYFYPSKKVGYYINPDKSLSHVGRVVLVELDNDSSYPQISADITESLFHELQKRQVFGLSIVKKNDPTWRSLQINQNSSYALEQLSAIQNTLKCNAVLSGTITQFRPYPHMVVGLRLRLIDLSDGQLLWAVEQIWDTADKTIENRIKKYFQENMKAGHDPVREQLATISSLNFIKFVTYEIASTL